MGSINQNINLMGTSQIGVTAVQQLKGTTVSVLSQIISTTSFIFLIKRRVLPILFCLKMGILTLMFICIYGYFLYNSTAQYYVMLAMYGLAIGAIQPLTKSILA